jgi:hypothetical protein
VDPTHFEPVPRQKATTNNEEPGINRQSQSLIANR